MINNLQSNQQKNFITDKIITNDFWEELINYLKQNKSNETLIKFIEQKSIDFNIDKKNFLKFFINYLLNNKEYSLHDKWISVFAKIIHTCSNVDYIINYFLLKLKELYISL